LIYNIIPITAELVADDVHGGEFVIADLYACGIARRIEVAAGLQPAAS
jgi:hypothetical protein